MSTTYRTEAIEARRLHEYCESALASLSRADQRRWGEAYIRGLLFCDGRRSIRRIADEVGWGSDQSLQQFINQSPWDPQPVRQRMAALMAMVLRPTAWILEDVAFAKHGRQSAAIEAQFVPSQGRVRNCQLGAVAMFVSERGNVPVNWRLSIPQSWDTDSHRRRRAHLPAEQRHQPFWRYYVEMLNDISGDWGIPLAPAVVDARHAASVTGLTTELDNLGLEYVVRVSADVIARQRATPREMIATPVMNGRPAGAGPYPTPLERTTVTWRSPVLPHSIRSQFAVLPARIPPAAGRRADRSLLVEWPLGGTTPRECWLTNITDRPIPELVALAKTLPQARQDLDHMTQTVGLGHHEGRSFIGWHHHVTLVSLAHAFLALETVRESEQSDAFEQAVNGLFSTQLEDTATTS
jgi:SRSO17 transposase